MPYGLIGLFSLGDVSLSLIQTVEHELDIARDTLEALVDIVKDNCTKSC